MRGWQVSPAELEQCLLLHPAIFDAAVIGINRGDGRGELPRAYVVLHPGISSDLTEEAVRSFMNLRLSRYKSLDGGVVWIDKIPRSAAGKILKPLLRELAATEIARDELQAISRGEVKEKRKKASTRKNIALCSFL